MNNSEQNSMNSKAIKKFGFKYLKKKVNLSLQFKRIVLIPKIIED